MEIRKTASSQMGIEIIFRDKRYFLTSERVQMIDLLLSTYEAAIQKNIDFKSTNEKLQQAREELESRVQERTAELKERVKEIDCLYAVSNLVAQPRKTINESLKVAVDLIPPGWHYPEITRARIVFEGREFATDGFRETPWKKSSDIVISGETVGTVDICYLEEMPALDEGPFLKEEQGLIDDLARQISVMIQRERAHAHLSQINSVLKSIRDVNKLIVHEKRRGPLIQMACENLTRTRGLQGAWIVLTDGRPDRVEGAQSGYNDISFSELLNLFQRGQMPACFHHGKTDSGVNVIEDTTSVCRNCPLVDTYAGSCAITIELKHGRRRYGCMGIAIPIEFANDKEEASLFEEIAGDIAFALASIEQEESLQNTQKVLDARARIAGAFLTVSDEDVFIDVLDIVLSIMQSEFGAYGYIDENGDYVVPSMTRHIWDECQVPDKDIRFPRDTWGDSSWCRAIREKRTFHSNQPSAKVPAGHVPIQRNVAAPIVFQGEVIGLLQVANKDTDYDADDIKLLETISDVIAPILKIRLQRDHQERKRAEAEKAIAASELRYRRLFESAKDGILIMDAETEKVIDVNPFLIDLLGFSHETLIGKELWELGLFKDRVDNQNKFAELLQKGYVRYEHLPLETADGRKIEVEFVSNVYQVSDHNVIQCNIRDITEQNKLQQQFIQAQKMESVGRLAGGVAHDYNNMLSVILGYTEIALDKVDPTDPLHADLEEIRLAAKRSINVTRQLLAFARKQTVDPRVLDLNEVLDAMLKMLRQLIGEDIDLAWHPRENLWPVKADPSQLDQILANLCVNARDAIAGVGKVTIETDKVTFDEAYCVDHAGFVPGEFTLLAVSDSGCGMDKKTLANLFEPFFTTKGVGQGTGLGLATVYGIVKQNDGFINVYSEQGKGTTFRIYLPRHAGEAEALSAESTAEIPKGRGETVLLVEDEASILKLANRILDGLGYNVLIARTPNEAIGLAKEHVDEIQLLITDVVMPEMNGRDLAEELRTLYPDIKILFMSGYTANVIAHRGVLAKSVNFLQKPFSKKDLAAKVRKVLDEVKHIS